MNSVKRVVRRVGLRRDHLRAGRVRAERNLLARLPRHAVADAGRVLCYHGVGTSSWGYNDVSPKRFRSQLELALERGYRFVPPGEIARTGGCRGELAVTFDDGLRSVGEHAAPILARLGIPWLLFVVTDWTAGREHRFGDVFLGWPELVELASSWGGMVGSHSVRHPDFGRLDPQSARQELVDSRQEIEKRTGLHIDSFAIPFGQSHNWNSRYTDIAREAGYINIYAQTVSSLPGTVPRTFITSYDDDRVFLAALEGAFDSWEE